MIFVCAVSSTKLVSNVLIVVGRDRVSKSKRDS